MPQLPISVFKFGGTSVGSPAAVRQCVAQVREHSGALCVVVSAMSGVTDLLLGAARSALLLEAGNAQAAAAEFSHRHTHLVEALCSSRSVVETLKQEIHTSSQELLAICQSVAVLRELTPRTLDAVAARGERVLARVFQAFLVEQGIGAVFVDACSVIQMARRLGSLWPDWESCSQKAQAQLMGPLQDGQHVVLPGFIGAGPEGEVVTLGRGGSDFSAAIVGRLVNATGVTLYKEVDGLMTADPRWVPDARVVPDLHYREAAELAYYGAKVLHPRTMIPLVDKEIPLYIKNTFNPSFSGTRIAADVKPGVYPVKALTAFPAQALISVEGNGLMGVPGMAARTFAALSAAGHSVSMISQASSESSICFTVPHVEAEHARRALLEAFAQEMQARLIDSVRVEGPLALLAVVGLGMRGTPGIAARTFAALSRNKINVVAIAQGSSELNITVAIQQDHVGTALTALHGEYQLNKIRALPDRDGHEASLVMLGVGQIGRSLARQILSQQSYFLHDLGLQLRTVALADRTGVRVVERGFSSTELEEILKAKSAGQGLGTNREGTAEDSASALKRLLWSLPLHCPILVDLTAADTAPLLLDALNHGFHAVLANKKPLAVAQAQYDALVEAAQRRGVALRYEATVGAGLPVLDTLAKLKEAGDEVHVVLGCLSGTLGYLMTQLQQGLPFSAAVTQAHALGYTEPDPREDLWGMDVARKALILARTLGRKMDLQDIHVQPLFPEQLSDANAAKFMRNLSQLDLEYADQQAAAQSEGKVLRYVARISPTEVRVGLEAVAEASPMGRLNGADNQVVIHTRRYSTNPLVVTGPGAGAEVTAAGVLNDVVAIATGLGTRPPVVRT
jgi:aspartokinase/homoserine dehydrogenase 1